ncbi:prolyl oligopeptidase family serine peptidase [Pendulispora brunnea]|uniref:prolyl oligopeptidase n=1 Tax=Pendulispora brunnea TaxID=2905690 RepID=A0ABZ2K0W7_9BACT
MRTTIVFFALATSACAQSSTTTTTSVVPPHKAVATRVNRVEAPPQNEPRREVVEEDVFGFHLVDPYRWMEKKENVDEVSRWLLREGHDTRTRLDAIPALPKLRERVRELGMAQAFATDIAVAGDLLFYFKTEKGGDLRTLIVRSNDGRERVLVDPAAMMGPNGKHVSIDHFQPSADGKWVAFGLAEGGGEIANERIVETKTGRLLPDVLPRIWGEFQPQWRTDGAGLYYTAMVPAAELEGADPMQNMRVRYHRLGESSESDALVFGRALDGGPQFEPQEFPKLNAIAGGKWVLGTAGGARLEHRIFVASAKDLSTPGRKPTWKTIADYKDHVEGSAPHGDDIYVLSSKDTSNRRILRTSLKSPNLANAIVIVPESEDVIERIAADAKFLYVHRSHQGRSRLQRFSFVKGTLEELKLPFEGWIDELKTDPTREGLTLTMQGWTEENRYFSLTTGGVFKELALTEPSNIAVSGFVAEEIEIKSADGTMVPLTIMRRQDLSKDGSHPTILDGYGAYGYSLTPVFRPNRFAWLERGGIYAIAHVRGGGEKGDAWRIGGKGTNKANGIQDFVACGEYLVREKYTSPARLAATGRSFGGILVGRALTERPDLFAAGEISVGELNPVRFLAGDNGANQMAELGSPDTESGFRTLLAMDAFHNVRAGVKYPPIMLETGLNDGRVPPWMSAKFGAQLRANGGNVWMRVERDEGHGVGSMRRQRFDLYADIYAFFLHQMGDPDFRH